MYPHKLMALKCVLCCRLEIFAISRMCARAYKRLVIVCLCIIKEHMLGLQALVRHSLHFRPAFSGSLVRPICALD